MVVVRLVRVVKKYRGKYALRGVDLEVKDNAITVLFGPVGAGKTTLLRIVAGLEKPDEGSVIFGDRDVTRLPPQERNVGLVFQTFALYPHLTVFENIASPLRAKGVPEGEVRKRVYEVASLLKITDILERRPAEISGGQRQRVAIARALVKDASIYLFDEPLVNLDYKIREAMRGELKKILRERGGTMLWATSDPQEALALGDYAAVIIEGVVQQYGRVSEVYAKPRNPTVAKLFSYPPANILKGAVVVKNGAKLVDLGFVQLDVTKLRGVALLEPGSEVVVAIRPTELKVGTAVGLTAVKCNVILSEVIGSETLLHVESGGTRLVVHLPYVAKYSPGDTVEVSINPAKALIYTREGELVYTPYA